MIHLYIFHNNHIVATNASGGLIQINHMSLQEHSNNNKTGLSQIRA